MSGRNKNIKTRFSDFLSYMKGELPEEERNLFERELQKDPFAEEAEEGFSTILPDDISEDFRRLQAEPYFSMRLVTLANRCRQKS